MSDMRPVVESPTREQLDTMRRYRTWFIGLGIVLMLLGFLAIALPLLAALAVDILLGWLLLFGGVAYAVHAFSARDWGGFLWQLLLGLLYLVAGIILLLDPMQGVLTLTLILAVLFLVSGVFRIVQALRLREAPNWGWLLLSGVLSVVVGLLIWGGWPGTALWAIGVLVGIDLVFAGMALMMLAQAAGGDGAAQR